MIVTAAWRAENRRQDLRAPTSMRWTCSRGNASTLQRERAASPWHDKGDGHIQEVLCVYFLETPNDMPMPRQQIQRATNRIPQSRFLSVARCGLC